ncbi:MAG: YolD-like family protein [Clostridia bacterium]|nr:YolD-like family protein [Clostridia bacterium]
MSRAERAKQFMPFAALRGYGAVIREKEKIITPKKELTDEQAEHLSVMVSELKKGDVIKVVYYDTDGYVEKTGAVSGINIPLSTLNVVKTQIPFSEIYSIDKIER